MVRKNKTKTTKKNNCSYCGKGIPHMIVTLDSDGDCHVHAPFGNDNLMTTFKEAIATEEQKWVKDRKISKTKKRLLI